MLNKKALSAAVQAAAGGATYVEDVFSTYLYTGNGSTQTITNGIDLSGEGGLTWIKRRDGSIYGNKLVDTVRGATKSLSSNSTAAEATESSGLTSFGSTGFSLDSNVEYNASNAIYASWTFRKAAKFFDVVTYTGTGSNRTVNHNLGSVPGCIIVKRTDTTGSWPVYHRSRGNTKYNFLNDSAVEPAASSTYWNNTTPTSTEFTVGTNTNVNANGGTYVAYLFAHNEAAFGDNSDQVIISCDQISISAGSTGTVTLGWEPQFVLNRGVTDVTDNWRINDSMRNHTVTYTGATSSSLKANTTGAETADGTTTDGYSQLLSNGFTIYNSDTENSRTYIYIAIRRGPMKTPTDATKVFMPTVYTGTNVDNRLINTTIAPDFVMIRQRDDTVIPGMYTGARMTGQQFLITGSTNSSAADADSFDAQIVSTVEYGNAFSSMSGVWVGNDATRKFNVNTTSNNHVIEAFKRAPGFFDVVCYTGNATAGRTVSHNLGVAPELLIVKSRGTASTNWNVYAAPVGNTKYLLLNTSDAEATGTNYWNSTTPTSTVFTLGNSAATNASGGTFLALLFASCPGVSKVGTYTGSSSNVTVDCGFTAGARFVLIKCTSTAGNWWLFDTARGIVAGNDPRLYLNTTDAEDSSVDYIDYDSTGFIVNSGTQVNANGETFIYLAIA